MWHVAHATGVPGFVALFRARCLAWAPATLGNAVVAPEGGFAWHEVQFVTLLGSETWHEVQRGAPETGDAPVTAWQVPQFAVKVAEVVWVCAVLSKNGTGWFGADGPFTWHALDTAPGAPFV